MQFSDILLCLHIAKQQNLRFFLYIRFNMFVSNAPYKHFTTSLAN